MTLKKVFNTLVENLVSDHGLKSFVKGLYETKLVLPQVHLGSSDTRKELKKEITDVNIDENTGRKSLKISKIDLSEIFVNKQKRANKILYFSLCTIGVTISLIIIGFMIMFIERSQFKQGIIIVVSSILPGVISGTAFWLHRNVSYNLMFVEQDIMKIAKLESFIEMTQYISNEEQKTKAYEKIIELIGSNKKPVKKILFLAANPKTTPWLCLDEEVREIEDGLRRSKHRGQFEIKPRLAVRLRDLRRALLDYEPQIVHISGHGWEDGLVLEGDLGIEMIISSETLSGLFELCSDKIECVILSACYSVHQAAAINKHINYVIGMQKEINDKAALEFAVGFYDALGAGKSVEEAFKFGCNAILEVSNDLPGHLIPVLKKRKI